MVLFTICVIIIFTPKQFPGLSVSYLQNSTQILNMIDIIAVSKAMVVFDVFTCHTLICRVIEFEKNCVLRTESCGSAFRNSNWVTTRH